MMKTYSTRVRTYTACEGVVQPEASVTFTHDAQVGADTAAIYTATFIWILLWAVACEKKPPREILEEQLGLQTAHK